MKRIPVSTAMYFVYSGFLFASLTSVVIAQFNKTAQTCLAPINKVNYTCETNQMIHVISVLYQEASGDCEVPADACEIKEDALSNGLTTSCNGNVTCSDDKSTFRITQACGNITMALATVSYECVSESPINVCGSTVISSGDTNTLYLSSPNYPERSGESSLYSTCVCHIDGTDMSVEILEIYFLFNPKVRANLTITGDNSSWKSHPNTFLAYNTKIINKSSTLNVTFDAYSRTSQSMWIKIQGTSEVTATCNNGASTTTLIPVSTLPITRFSKTTAASTGTPIHSSSVTLVPTSTSTVDSTAQSNYSLKPAESNTVAVAVGSVFGVLVVAAIVIVVIFIMMRRKRLKPYLSSHDDDGGSMKHVEEYQMSLASQEASGSKPSDNGYGPPSPDYADVEPMGDTKAGIGGSNTFVCQKSQTSCVPSSSDYAEITPHLTTASGNAGATAKSSQPSPHYYVLEPMATAETVRHDIGSISNQDTTGRGPVRSEYAEPYTLGVTETDAKQNISPENGSGNVTDSSKSSVPYTNKRLEELYAKVVPKKFRSTRDMREAEKKKNAKSKRKSHSDIHGITNDAYDNEDEKKDDNGKEKTKHRRSRSKSDPDYQEIGTASVSEQDSHVSPPVPPKLGGILDEFGTETQQKGQKTDVLTKDKISDENQAERSSSSDTRAKSEPVTHPDSTLQSGFGEGANTPAGDSDDKLVMVDNVLYETTGPDHTTANGNLVADGSAYEDIRHDLSSSRPIVIGDTRVGRPAAYEEINV